jgi:hypothetical protein
MVPSCRRSLAPSRYAQRSEGSHLRQDLRRDQLQVLYYVLVGVERLLLPWVLETTDR